MKKTNYLPYTYLALFTIKVDFCIICIKEFELWIDDDKYLI